MPKIYTKTGDKGKTSTLGGKRICKCCLEMEAVGEVDELNAFLGILIEELDNCHCERPQGAKQSQCNSGGLLRRSAPRNDTVERIIQIQHNLFTIGANLAALQTDLKNIPKLQNFEISKLEKWIDEMDRELPELKNFILPGGCEEAALSFYARAVCRRAERCVIKLSGKQQVPPEIKRYLNRLSDCLFVLARWLNFKNGIKEVKWKK